MLCFGDNWVLQSENNQEINVAKIKIQELNAKLFVAPRILKP
jgi:hypothetical protein